MPYPIGIIKAAGGGVTNYIVKSVDPDGEEEDDHMAAASRAIVMWVTNPQHIGANDTVEFDLPSGFSPIQERRATSNGVTYRVFLSIAPDVSEPSTPYEYRICVNRQPVRGTGDGDRDLSCDEKPIVSGPPPTIIMPPY